MNSHVIRLIEQRQVALDALIAAAERQVSDFERYLSAGNAELVSLRTERDALSSWMPARKPAPMGHWLAANVHETDRLPYLPGVAGVQRRVYWRDIESRPGEYLLAQIQLDLAECDRLGIDYQLQVLYKSFSDASPVPADLERYCHRYTATKGEKETVGWTYAWWSNDPYPLDRLIALYQAIGSEFDAHPRFAGIATQESASSLTADQYAAAGYTPEGSFEGLSRLVRGLSAALPTSWAWWYMNFLEGGNGRLLELAGEFAGLGNVMLGGPDILPENPGLIRHAYPVYRATQTPKFCSMQHDSILLDDHARLAAFAEDNLGAQAIIWNDTHWATGQHSNMAAHIADNPI